MCMNIHICMHIGCIVFIYSMYVGALCAVYSVWCFMFACIACSFETHYQDHLCHSLVEETRFKSRFIHDFSPYTFTLRWSGLLDVAF